MDNTLCIDIEATIVAYAARRTHLELAAHFERLAERARLPEDSRRLFAQASVHLRAVRASSAAAAA